MSFFRMNRAGLAVAALLACGFTGSARGSSFGISVSAGGGAGSAGCSTSGSYSTSGGGTFTSDTGFDTVNYLSGSCSASGGPSVTTPGATAASISVAQSAAGAGAFAGLMDSSSGSAAASLATGIINLNDLAVCSTATNICMSNNSGATMFDTITVLGLTSAPTPVTLTFILDGTISGESGGDDAVAGLFVVQGNAPSSGSGSGAGQCEWAIGLPTESSAYGCFNSSFTTYQETDTSVYGQNSSNVNVTISATFDLSSSNPTFGFNLFWNQTANVDNCVGAINSNCGTSNDMNFINTGAFSLNTGGLDYSSASGVFLTQPGGQSSVPEPATLALSGIVLTSLGLLRRYRRVIS
jgi:hypothetical protein